MIKCSGCEKELTLKEGIYQVRRGYISGPPNYFEFYPEYDEAYYCEICWDQILTLPQISTKRPGPFVTKNFPLG